MSRQQRVESKETTNTSELLAKRARKQAEQQAAQQSSNYDEVEYLDAMFDDASLEAEVLELTKGGISSNSFDNMRAFGSRSDSQDVLRKIKEVRHLQQEIYHDHLNVEIKIDKFVQDRSKQVSKADASKQFCAEFRDEFNSKKKNMERVSSNLEKLATSVEEVNRHVGEKPQNDDDDGDDVVYGKKNRRNR